MNLQRLFPILLLAVIAIVQRPAAASADIQHAAAASYIEALFATNMRDGAGKPEICPEAAAFGRFSTGRAWRAFTATERAAFDRGFCDLAADAVSRLRTGFPKLGLRLQQSFPGAPGIIILGGEVTGAAADSWPVEFFVAGEGQSVRIADMKIVGVSLGIFLRSLAILMPAREAGDAPSPDGILEAWRRALDRALPSPAAQR